MALKFPVCSCVLVFAFAAGVTPLFAQPSPTDSFKAPPGPRRFDISGGGGFMLSTDWSDLVLLGRVSPVSGAFEQVLLRDVVVNPGAVFDGTLTYWEGRLGFRAHTGFASSCMAVGRSCGDLAALAGSSGNVDVDVWSYDIGGAVGLMEYKPGRFAWPYVFAGIGGVTYDLQRTIGPPLTIIESPPSSTSRALVVHESSDNLLISVDELGLETTLAVNFGVGTDFRIPLGPASLGLRLELSDHVHESPIRLRVSNVDDSRRSDTSIVDFGLVHNLRASAGIVLQFGR